MSRRRLGFTRMELLVVIATIAILAAILFPVFAQAKEAAKKTARLSNTKQVGLATMQCVTDYEGAYPCRECGQSWPMSESVGSPNNIAHSKPSAAAVKVTDNSKATFGTYKFFTSEED